MQAGMPGDKCSQALRLPILLGFNLNGQDGIILLNQKINLTT